MPPTIVLRSPTLWRSFARLLPPPSASPLLLPRVARFHVLADRPAIVDGHGPHTYAQLAARAAALGQRLSALPGGPPRRVALLCPRDVSYVVAMLGTWTAGACAVPLGLDYPPADLAYFVQDSGTEVVLLRDAEGLGAARPALSGLAEVLPLLDDDCLAPGPPPQPSLPSLDVLLPFTASRPPAGDAVVVYTSGTTGRPKGVLVSHANLAARVAAMREAWRWSGSDEIVNCLPLHHVHGVENCLLTPLSVGATCRLMPPGRRFDAARVWAELVGPDASANLFMAVPTIYAKLIEHCRALSQPEREHVRRRCQERFRLMVSGSAALPDPVLHEWQRLTGHTLLERYGMTELGMALTNPLEGPRLPGHVGRPFPGVEVRIGAPSDASPGDYDVLCEGSAEGTTVLVDPGDSPPTGELLVRGPAVFREYLGRPAATAEAFTRDGWFRTGDTAQFDAEANAYRLLGRTSVDVIKRGGYKLSALDVERRLAEHEAVALTAVVGLPDPVWGQRVVAAVVLRADATAAGSNSAEDLREWARGRMPPHLVPAEVHVMGELPTNAMGKVNKKELTSILIGDNQPAE